MTPGRATTHQGRPHSQTSWTHKLDLNGEKLRSREGKDERVVMGGDGGGECVQNTLYDILINIAIVCLRANKHSYLHGCMNKSVCLYKT